LTGFNSRVNEPRSTRHSVKEQLAHGQTRNIRVLDEPTCFRRIVELVVVRKRPALEPIRIRSRLCSAALNTKSSAIC
jgi:hypothetical protein